MKALTLWQPYASLLIKGLKTYETRSWELPEPGWIAIHAAKSEPAHVRDLIAQDRRLFRNALRILDTTFDDLPRGAVLGLALFDEPRPVERVRMTIGAADADFGDWTDGRYAWPVANVWLFPRPVPARGRQRLWTWTMPADLETAFRFWHGDEAISPEIHQEDAHDQPNI